MIQKNKLRVELYLYDNLSKDTKKYVKDFGYTSVQELLREALREKLYGRTRNEEIDNISKKISNQEDKYLFEQNKDLYEKLKKIEKNI